MENKISLVLADETGAFIPIDEKNAHVESQLETLIAEVFTEINTRLNNELLDDDERRIAEKFRLCQHLKNFMEELER